ncbi:MAG: cell division protein SepF [Clostridia bacterium]|nr:cell division protein SepF [Clostridia bacterium]
MAFIDKLSDLVKNFGQGPFRPQGEDELTPNMANGGHSGYHPVYAKVQKKRPSLFRKNEPQNVQTPQSTPQSAPQSQPQSVPLSGPGPAQTPPQSQMQPQWTGYVGGGMTGAPFAPGMNPAMQTGTPPYTAPQTSTPPQQSSAPGGWSMPLQPQSQPSVPNNISYMPGQIVQPDGTAYRHVERLTQPMSIQSCYRLIEFMRNGESIIVNTELLPSPEDVTRSLDLLYGAAFSMGYTFTRISSRSIYLITPDAVKVIPYESLRQFNEQNDQQMWPGAQQDRDRRSEEARRRENAAWQHSQMRYQETV